MSADAVPAAVSTAARTASTRHRGAHRGGSERGAAPAPAPRHRHRHTQPRPGSSRAWQPPGGASRLAPPPRGAARRAAAAARGSASRLPWDRPPLCRPRTAPRRAAALGHRRPARKEAFPAAWLPIHGKGMGDRGVCALIFKASCIFSLRNQVAEIVGGMPPPPLRVSRLCCAEPGTGKGVAK